MTFGSRFSAAREAYGPLCVGLDPHPQILQAWAGEDSLESLTRFAEVVVEAFAGQIAFVKPQSAFFERFGSAGVVILEWLLQQFRHTGTLTVLDVKRGDIDSTAAAYATAYLDDDSPMAADAITVSPYLGFGSLAPFFAEAERNDAGVFVLALTSNPDSPQFQHARTARSTVAGEVLAELARLNSTNEALGSFGAVVGATASPADGENFNINGPILVPGFGAQGGTVSDMHRLLGEVWDACAPSSSREILQAGPDPRTLREAATTLSAELVATRL